MNRWIIFASWMLFLAIVYADEYENITSNITETVIAPKIGDCYVTLEACEIFCENLGYCLEEHRLKICCVTAFQRFKGAIISCTVVGAIVIFGIVGGFLCFFVRGCPWYNYRQRLDADLATPSTGPMPGKVEPVQKPASIREETPGPT